jgi:hypothetical protein
MSVINIPVNETDKTCPNMMTGGAHDLPVGYIRGTGNVFESGAMYPGPEHGTDGKCVVEWNYGLRGMSSPYLWGILTS